MDEKLLKACEGKSASQGGLNVPELHKMAVAKGYTGAKKRADILAFLCKPATTKPAKPVSTKPATKPVAPAAPVVPAPAALKPLSANIGLFIEPLQHMHTDKGLNYVFESLTDDKKKLEEFFEKVPLTKSIVKVLKYSLDHDGHLKPSSLVNLVDLNMNHLFRVMGLPSTKGMHMHDLVSVASLSDECDFGGYLFFKSTGIRLVTPDGKRHETNLVKEFTQRVKEVRSKKNCSVVMFGLGVPGHAMILSVQGENLYIFDTNSAFGATTWREYWQYTEKYARVDVQIADFLRLLLDDGIISKVFINNWTPITDLPFIVHNIPFDEICPNFQGRSSHFRQLMMSAQNKYGVNMFPGGFCLPWSFITIATYMTHGAMAPYVLQDFLVNPDYYVGYHRDDIPGLQILFIHLISVYLTEIVTAL